MPLDPPWAIRGVSAALALQLTATAAALAGPWSLAPPTAPQLAAPVARAAAVTEPTADPVVLSAAGLWTGAIPLAPLSVGPDGALEVPATADGLGWWSAGPRPGEPGAAVVVGHVDLDGRPGVFARLGSVAPGTLVVVGSGSDAVRFRVTGVERYPKADFPTEEVYRPTAASELRLITCGGRFDRSTGHYEDNVVVRAVRA